MSNVIEFGRHHHKERLAAALSAAGIWWLEPLACTVRINPGRYSTGTDAKGWSTGSENIGGYWELDFSWEDRSIGMALAVHFKEPRPISSYFKTADMSNKALHIIGGLQGWRIIMPDTSERGWVQRTVAEVAEALKGTPWASDGAVGGTRAYTPPPDAAVSVNPPVYSQGAPSGQDPSRE